MVDRLESPFLIEALRNSAEQADAQKGPSFPGEGEGEVPGVEGGGVWGAGHPQHGASMPSPSISSPLRPLQRAAGTALTLNQLQMMFGPVFKALKEKVVTSSFSKSAENSRARASQDKIEKFQQVCCFAGVLFEHAEILSCLPSDKLLSVQVWF